MVSVNGVCASPHDSTLHKSVQRYCFILYITTEIIKKLRTVEYLTALKIKGLSKAMSFNGADITIVRDKVREYATLFIAKAIRR